MKRSAPKSLPIRRHEKHERGESLEGLSSTDLVVRQLQIPELLLNTLGLRVVCRPVRVPISLESRSPWAVEL